MPGGSLLPCAKLLAEERPRAEAGRLPQQAAPCPRESHGPSRHLRGHLGSVPSVPEPLGAGSGPGPAAARPVAEGTVLGFGVRRRPLLGGPSSRVRRPVREQRSEAPSLWLLASARPPLRGSLLRPPSLRQGTDDAALGISPTGQRAPTSVASSSYLGPLGRALPSLDLRQRVSRVQLGAEGAEP